jgi:N utilization substance protein B
VAARSKARKRAVDLLYESDLRGTDPVTVLAERVALADPPVNDYTIELVEGVHGVRRRIDAILGEFSEGWTVARMPDVDRAILRLSVYEVLWRPDVPDAVAIDEAVELAKSLSTDESPRFVNGVLGRIVRDRPEIDVPTAAGSFSPDDGVDDVPAAELADVTPNPLVEVDSHAEPRA